MLVEFQRSLNKTPAMGMLDRNGQIRPRCVLVLRWRYSLLIVSQLLHEISDAVQNPQYSMLIVATARVRYFVSPNVPNVSEVFSGVGIEL
jgi:hypothetical protein